MIRVGDTGAVQGGQYLPPPPVRQNAIIANTANALAGAAPTGGPAGAQDTPPQLTPQQQNALWLSRLAADASQLFNNWTNPAIQAQIYNDIKMILGNTQDPTIQSFGKQLLSVQGQSWSAINALWVTGVGTNAPLSAQFINIFNNPNPQEFALSYSQLTPDTAMNVYMFVINSLPLEISNQNYGPALDKLFFGLGGNGSPGMLATTFGEFVYTYFIEQNTQNGTFNAAGFKKDIENFENMLNNVITKLVDFPAAYPNFNAALYGTTIGGVNYPGFFGMGQGDDSIVNNFLTNPSTYWPATAYFPFDRPSLQESDTLPSPWWDNPVVTPGQYNLPSKDPFFVFAINNAWNTFFNDWPPPST